MATVNSLLEEEASAMDTTSSDPLHTHGSKQENESTTFRDRKKNDRKEKKIQGNKETN